MKKARNMSKKLIAILLSAAMTFTPMVQSMPVYAAEVEMENGAEELGVMPETDELENVVSDDISDDGDAQEASGEEQDPNDADSGEIAKDDDVSDAESKDDDADAGKDANTEKVEENTEEKTETKAEAKEDTELKETVSEPVYEEVMEEESESASDSEEESESESEEMSQEEVRASYSITANDVTAGGWNESIYAEIKGVTDTSAITDVSWSGAMTGSLDAAELSNLVRKIGGNTRIDIPGLKAGKYTLSITVNGTANPVKKENIEVSAYDRSGFAHFKYTRGVGAYNDDGTLKDNAIVLYVTDQNKNTVELSYGGVTVRGIGNILNSVGKDAGNGKNSNGGVANTNQGIIKKLAENNVPLVVRFIGNVSETGLYAKGTYDASDAGLIEGLTDYSSIDNGGTKGDNGHMARIQSGKDITLEGIGYDATIDGWGFHFISEGAAPNLGESFEVRNLTFINTPEDAIGMEGQQESKNTSSNLSSSVERCWIHNNEFYCPSITKPAESDKSEGDGSVDFKRGQYFTCSYNYFEACHKTNLVGSADYSLQFNLTYHHNYWYLCKARGPLARNANIHMYNNIVEMQTDYAQNVRANAYIFSEYNMFYACKSPQAVESGAIKSYHDTISSVIWNKGSAGTVVTDKSTYVPNNCQFQARGIKYDKFDVDPALSYIPDNDYLLTTDFTELRKVITAKTGVMDQQIKAPENVAESEYSVIPRMGDTVYQVKDTDFGVSLNVGDKNGKINKKGYAFSVNAPFNIKITYASSTSNPGVLVNAAGENLLEGSGEAINLPEGTYMIQSQGLQPGNPLSLTLATFKEATVESVVLEKFDSTKHYHNWSKNASKSIAPTCTAEGKDVYDCVADGCSPDANTKEETVPALGHNYVWKTDQAATTTETGLKHRECTRCGDKQDEGTVIPVGSSGGSNEGDTGIITDAGDYVITFPGKKPAQDGDFFKLTSPSYKDKGTATVNGETYKGSFAFSSKSQISFTCNEGATLFMVFDSGSANKTFKLNGEEKTIGSDGTVTIEELQAGTYTFSKGNAEALLVYMSVANAAPKVNYYNVSFAYNDDDGREPITVQIVEGTSYATMEALVPSSFSISGYVLKGLYKDASCEVPVVYPYVVNEDAYLYAEWEKDGVPTKDIYIIGLEPSYPYTGAKIIPDIEVWDYDIPGGKLLAQGTDYTVAYKNNVKPGEQTAEVTVTGKGNYAGKDVSQKFSIVEIADVTENLADLKGAKIDKISDVEFNGNAQYPDFILTEKGGSLVTYTQNTDPNVKGLYKRTDNEPMNVNIVVSNNINKGTATILVTGAADAKGKATSIKKTFKITAIDLTAKADKVTVDKPEDVEYAVSGAIPDSVTVKYDGKTLKQGKDYTVKYTNNKKAGKGSITITGKGNYAKKYPTPVEYEIIPLDLSDLKVNAVTAYDGVTAGKVKATVLDKNGMALKASQYTVKIYKTAEGEETYDAADVLTEGNIYVAVEAKDTINLDAETATPRAEFKVGKDISKAKFTLKKGVVKEYTGSEVKLNSADLEVTMKDVPSLEMGRDYVVAAYSNNINKGTATAIIKGIGDYSGTKTVKFKITQKSMIVGGTSPWDNVSKALQNFVNNFKK